MICWKCHESVGSAVCVGCGGIQPPPPAVDFFGVLGLERRYHVDDADIERAWRGLSRQVHTDRFAGRPAVERRMSLQWTATVNEARRVLKDPLLRARYLATGRSRPDESRRIQLDPDFLEEMFDLQMEARMDPDGVRERATSLREEITSEIDALFTAWEGGGGDIDAAKVEDLLSRLKYVDNALTLVDASGADPAPAGP